jgi:hypothetical protein
MLTDEEYNIWYKSYDPNFTYINKKSLVPDKWLLFKPVKEKYKDSIIKPINSYVDALYPKPKLISIVGNRVRLRQENHAEIYLAIKKDGSFYNIDRPWIRQYYQSAKEYEAVEDCFPGTYCFYTPWVLDENIDIKFEQPDAISPFHIYSVESFFKKNTNTLEYLEPQLIPFSFMSVGDHIVDRGIYGRIRIGSPMYDIVFEASDEIINKIGKFYDNY